MSRDGLTFDFVGSHGPLRRQEAIDMAVRAWVERIPAFAAHIAETGDMSWVWPSEIAGIRAEYDRLMLDPTASEGEI